MKGWLDISYSLFHSQESLLDCFRTLGEQSFSCQYVLNSAVIFHCDSDSNCYIPYITGPVGVQMKFTL